MRVQGSGFRVQEQRGWSVGSGQWSAGGGGAGVVEAAEEKEGEGHECAGCCGLGEDGGGEGGDVDSAVAVEFVPAGGAEVGGGFVEEGFELVGGEGGVDGEGEGGRAGGQGGGEAGAADPAVALLQRWGDDA